jgi:hypothetical protein
MQNFKQRYILLYASPYSIENKADGTKNEGVTAYMILDDNLNPRIDEEAAGRGQDIYGLKPVKQTLPYNAMAKIVHAPGIYDVTLKMEIKRVNIRGRDTEMPTMIPIDLEYVGALDTKVKPKEAKVAS